MGDPVLTWLKSGEYLPEPLRDFHDQKDVFKAMHERQGHADPTSPATRVDWITGQCYVIDSFLWFMARRGWTLQRSRKPLPFRDLAADVSETMAKIHEDEAAVFAGAFARGGVTAKAAETEGLRPEGIAPGPEGDAPNQEGAQQSTPAAEGGA